VSGGSRLLQKVWAPLSQLGTGPTECGLCRSWRSCQASSQVAAVPRRRRGLELALRRGSDLLPPPGAPPPSDFHQRTRRHPQLATPPTHPMSRQPTSTTADLPARPAPPAHRPPSPRNAIPSTPQPAPQPATKHTHRRPRSVLPIRPLPTDSSQPSLSLFSTSTLLPARSTPTLCAWPHQNICDVVGRGRGSPGRSEAERRGPPSSMPGAEPNPARERAAGCPSGVFAL
jgi:hypothetical protein